MPLKRKTPLRPGKPIKRGTKDMRRSGKVKPVNRERKAESLDRNFGEEAKAVRLMPCLVTGSVYPSAKIDPAHVVSVGAGGGRFDLIPLRWDIHQEQHVIGMATFAERYGIDPREAADRVAISHASPLGIRGLAQRWAHKHCPVCGGLGGFEMAGSAFAGCRACDGYPSEPLDRYELGALFGFVVRLMDREVERVRLAMERFQERGHVTGDCLVEPEPEWMSRVVGNVLGVDQAVALALCEAAQGAGSGRSW